jgi:septum formation inhibitor MinC
MSGLLRWRGTTVVDKVGSGEVVEDRQVVVLGDVESHGRALAVGGGARVVVFGDVHPGAEVGAQGGGATVVVLGRVQ